MLLRRKPFIVDDQGENWREARPKGQRAKAELLGIEWLDEVPKRMKHPSWGRLLQRGYLP